MEFFRKTKYLTENTMNFDVTFGVILSTVPYGAVEKSYKMQQIDKGRLFFRLIQEVL